MCGKGLSMKFPGTIRMSKDDDSDDENTMDRNREYFWRRENTGKSILVFSKRMYNLI